MAIAIPDGLALLIAGCLAGCDDTSDLEQRFRTEYPRAVQQLKQSLTNVAFRIHRVETRTQIKDRKIPGSVVVDRASPPVARETDHRCFIKRFPSGFAFLTIDQPGDEASLVHCDTPDYDFMLRTTPGGESSWDIWSYHDRKRPDEMEASGQMASDVLSPFYDYRRVSFEDMLRDPIFKVTKASELSDHGETLVELHYERSEYARDPTANVKRRAVFAPRLHWALREWEYVHGGYRITSSIDYAEGPDGLVFPKVTRWDYCTHDANGDEVEKGDGECQILDVTFNVVSDDQFTLAAFGLQTPPPSPPPVVGQWSSPPSAPLRFEITDWEMWFVLAASLSAGILVIFLYRWTMRWYKRHLP